MKSYAIEVHMAKKLPQEVIEIANEIGRRHVPASRESVGEWLGDLVTWAAMWEEEYKLSVQFAQDRQHISGLISCTRRLLGAHGHAGVILQRYQFKECGYDPTLLEAQLRQFEDLCDESLAQLPESATGGSPKNSYRRRCVYFLADRLQEMGATDLRCHWNELRGEGTYEGNLYLFLIDMRDLLAELGIDLGADNTVGQYGRDYLKAARRKSA